MNELGYQAKVKVAVKEMGGLCFKLSNRFLNGIPDLLVQIPEYQTSIWEVKYSQNNSEHWKRMIKATPLQKAFLRDFSAAGGLCGVISFVLTRSELTVCIKTTEQIAENVFVPWYFKADEYRTMKRGTGLETIKTWLREIHEERRGSGQTKNVSVTPVFDYGNSPGIGGGG